MSSSGLNIIDGTLNGGKLSSQPKQTRKSSGSRHIALSGTNNMAILSPSQISPPSLVITNDNMDVENDDTDTNFFKVLAENLKYSINSPTPNTQFPTPYSSNQDPNKNLNNISHSQQQQNSMDSSILESSINVGLYSGRNQQTNDNGNSSNNNKPLSTTDPTVDLLNTDGETLGDMNIQPSTVLQFGNNFPNEFLLASPEQLKEFLFDSPGGFNLFHSASAKTPLRFVTDSKDMNINLTSNTKSTSSSNLIHLFNSVSNQSDDQVTQDINNEMGVVNNGTDRIFTRTPLKKIDINLMFNSTDNSLANSISPSRKLSMSLTPYGRRILNEIGTPFTRNLNSSNSALVDFQKARKDVNTSGQLHSTPDDKSLPKKKVSKKNNKNNKLTKVNLNKANKKMAINQHIQNKDKKNHITKKKINAKLNYDKFNNNEDYEDDFDKENIYGSSPTTIQLNSSVTKSISRLDANKIPNLRNMNLIDDKLFEMNARGISLSPTPKSYTNNGNLNIETLKVPELPKMGSFKSETNNLTGSLSFPPTGSTQMNNRTDDSSQSSILSLSTETSALAFPINTNNSTKIKKIKKTKPKKPKFQVFVSSINKFNEPNTFVPISPKYSKRDSRKSSNKLKRSQSLTLKKKNSKNNSSQDSNKNDKDRTNGNMSQINRSNSMTNDEGFFNMY